MLFQQGTEERVHIFAFRIVCKFKESASMNMSTPAQKSPLLSNMVATTSVVSGKQFYEIISKARRGHLVRDAPGIRVAHSAGN